MQNTPGRDDLQGRPAPTPSRSPAWLRHLGFSVPLAASLALVLLVAGSLTVTRMVEGDAPAGAEGDVGDGAAGTRVPMRPVPLDRTVIEIDRPVDPDLGPVGTATDELRQRGDIGDSDTLTLAGREGRLGASVFTRTQQEHRGIPVFAADVVVATEDGRVVRIHGHPAPDIDVATTIPVNEYPDTVTLAAVSLDHTIAAEDDGTLVIMPVDGGGYRLAWLGVVVIHQGLEQVAFDSETGAVLHRAPVVRNVPAREASIGGDGGDGR